MGEPLRIVTADDSYLVREGAYLLKDRIGDVHRLLGALRDVVRGGSVVDPLVVEALATRRVRLKASPLATLTPRELDVLREMAQGRGTSALRESGLSG